MMCPFFDIKEGRCSIYMKWIEKNLKVERSGGCLIHDGEHCSYAIAEREIAPEKVVFT